MRVYLAPLDVVLGERTVLQPDLLVTTVAQSSGQEHQGVPLLAVEVLSPSTRHIDLGLKRSRYEAAGCTSYWVVDPDAARLRAWDLHDGSYVEVADVAGEAEAVLTRPFPVAITPARLLA